MSDELKKFRNALANKIGNDKYRLFDCVGSPFDCKVLLVGINSVSELEKSFWSYWSDECGFNHAEWLSDYHSFMLRTYGKIGKTRKMLELLREELKKASINLFCTNIYLESSKDYESLKNKKNNDINFLINEINPALVILMGGKVREYFEEMIQSRINKGKIEDVSVNGHNFKIFALTHFAVQTSYKQIKEYVNMVISELSKNVPEKAGDFKYE